MYWVSTCFEISYFRPSASLPRDGGRLLFATQKGHVCLRILSVSLLDALDMRSRIIISKRERSSLLRRCLKGRRSVVV